MRTRIALASAAAVASIIAGNTANAVTGSPARTSAPADRHVRADQPRPRARKGGAHITPAGPLKADWKGSAVGLLGITQLAAMTTTAPPAPAPSPAPEPPPPPPPPPVPVTDATSTNTADWACIRIHESGDRYNSSSAPSGAYGIVEVTWSSFGHSGWPYQAPAAEQDALALQLYHLYGWAPWSTRWACGL